MAIRILADEVVSQIAAGEVIERPASVVKELIENAIDANASVILIRTEDAGKRLIEITDNGCGIHPDELEKAVMRHATSKLRNAEDLFHIQTLGFRGEALAATGSVSRMSITTCTADNENGCTITVEGGKVTGVHAIGTKQGTTVRVADLFYNVPARLKFLKSDITERNQTETLISRYALAYPHIRWQSYHDGKPGIRTSGNGDYREVLAAIYGVDTAKQLLEINLEEESLRVFGFISPVALTRSNRREMNYFINGRWVQDIQLNSAVIRAYQTLIMVGRFPIAALFLSMEPEEVDVNVHPSKAEVRFRSPDRVFSAVHRAVRRGLIAQSPVPEISSPVQWPNWHPLNPQPASGSGQIDPAWQMSGEAKAIPLWRPNSAETVLPVQYHQTNGKDSADQGNHPESVLSMVSPDFPILRWIGQIGGTYIIAEGPDGLYLIDQHAAHERILFEKLLNQAASEAVAQSLLDPALVQLPAWQASLLEENLEVLKKLGFHIEPFGPSAFRVLAIPALFTKGNPEAAIRSVVEDFEEDETPLQSEIESRIAGRVCKRMAVKAGQPLSEEEQRALIRDLENCQSPRTCPHGRPTMIHLSINLLERQFGRKGTI
ncbi:MAG: DNA mismatch repair endonuclease MutL [Flexilinea sp.]